VSPNETAISGAQETFTPLRMASGKHRPFDGSSNRGKPTHDPRLQAMEAMIRQVRLLARSNGGTLSPPAVRHAR